MSLGKLRGKRELRNKIHRHTELTKHRWRQWQEMNLTSHSNWWAVKAGTSSRKINLDFGTDKTENRWTPGLGKVGEWMELYRPMGDVQEKEEQGGTKTRVDRKGYEKGLFCVNQHWSICSSGWALHLIITVFPVILLTLFLMISLIISAPVPHVCVLAATGETCVCEWKLVAATGVRAGGVGTHIVWYQLLEWVGWVGSSISSLWGRNIVCPENQLLGETSRSEVSKGLGVSGWTMTAGHSQCAKYWLLGGKCLYLPQTWCVYGCVHLYLLANLKLDSPTSERTSCPGQSIRQAGVCADTPRGTSECGVQQDKCVCMFSSEYQAGPASDWGPVGWVMGLGAGQENCMGRGAMPVLGRSANMCVCLGTWRVLCVCLH